MDVSTSVSDTTFTAFDFETTGLEPALHRIVEFGAAKFKAGQVIDTFEALVNPGVAIDGDAGKVSGITNEMVQDKPSVESMLAPFSEFIAGSVLIAHNAAFDVGFLRAALDAAGLPPVKNLIIDTQVLAQKAFPRLKSYSLQNLVTELNIPQGNAHRALDDAIMCMKLFLACADELSFMGEISLEEVLT
jgi:DNA polymerase III epsilon subunit family exonuclease